MTKKKKLPVTGGMRVKAYPVLVRTVAEGVAYGWQMAHKYNDKPSEDVILGQIESAIVSGFCEAFDFDDDEEKPAW